MACDKVYIIADSSIAGAVEWRILGQLVIQYASLIENNKKELNCLKL